LTAAGPGMGRGRGGLQFFAAPLPKSPGSAAKGGALTAEHMSAEQLREANKGKL